MKCIKKETRTIFDLFKQYNCEDCLNYCKDEEIKIGFNAIYIYYMGSCKTRYNETMDRKKAKLLFKDILLDSYNKKSKKIFLWLDIKDDFDLYFESFEGFLEKGYEIHIII